MQNEKFGAIPTQTYSGESPSSATLTEYLENWRADMVQDGNKITKKGIGWKRYTLEQWNSVQKLYETAIQLADNVKVSVTLQNDHSVPKKDWSGRWHDQNGEFADYGSEVIQGTITINEGGQETTKEFFMDYGRYDEEGTPHDNYAIFEATDEASLITEFWPSSEKDSRSAVRMNPTENDAKNILAWEALGAAYKKNSGEHTD